jgi:hypothetical protein
MLFENVKQLAILAIFAGHVGATTYAQFCNDDNCSVGCGTSVSVDNPGCLVQRGRRSVKFHGANLAKAVLVSSPGADCGCQNYCYDGVVTAVVGAGANTCVHLTGPSAESFRFVGEQSCKNNNC